LEKSCIAIDGPAGSGKSTIARLLSKKLNMVYIDTGAMYRAVAYHVLRNHINADNETEVSNIISNMKMEIKYENGNQRIFVDGEDITKRIRTGEVSMGASKVAKHILVREKLLNIQRNIASENEVVMDGRDIASHVLPNAKLKIYLNASIEERAKRRFKEMDFEKDKFEEIKRDIELRDEADKSRKNAPLIKVDDAIEIDTSNLKIKDVIDKIINLYSNI
jgi:cytidylate kinase